MAKTKYESSEETGALEVLNQGKISGQDLNSFFNMHSPSTFVFKVKSAALKADGISVGDIAVCDRSILVKDGDIIVICVDGRFYLRRFVDGIEPYLEGDENIKRIYLSKAKEIDVFGVVTGIFRKIAKNSWYYM